MWGQGSIRKEHSAGVAAISLLITVLIIALLAIFLLSVHTGSTMPSDKKADAPLKQARNVDCMNNLLQIRNAIELYSSTSGSYPSSLDSILDNIQGSVLTCPVSGKRYQYSPGNGRVWCNTPGHEDY